MFDALRAWQRYKTNETAKTVEYSLRPGKFCYAIKTSAEGHLVVDEYTAATVLQDIDLGKRELYHNSNLRNLPRRLHKGATEIPFGISLKPQTTSDLVRLLEHLQR